MDKINRHNYEVFFLDYVEGNLDASQKEELFTFLSLNPDLKVELDEFEIITLGNSSERFDIKNDLKKLYYEGDIVHGNLDQFIIASLEGDLNNSQQEKLDEFLHNTPAYRGDYRLYTLTKLQADNSIVFFGKKGLKRSVTGKILLLKKISVAASLLILAAILFFVITGEGENKGSLIATETKIKDNDSLMQDDVYPGKAVEQNQFTPYNNKSSVIINPTKTDDYNRLAELKVEQERFFLSPVQSINHVRINSQPDKILFAHIPVGSAIIERTDLISTIRQGVDDIALAMETGGIEGSGRLTIWDIADVGINGFGKITGVNVKLDKTRDLEGNVIALAFQSSRLNFTKRVNN